MENFYVQIYEACFRKDICYQSFSQNTKAAFNNAFVRRCKKSCIFSLAAFRTLGLSTRIRKPHFLPQNHASEGSYKMRRIVVWDFEVVTFSWTPRLGEQPPYGEVRHGAALQGRGPVHQIRTQRRRCDPRARLSQQRLVVNVAQGPARVHLDRKPA